MNRSPKFSPVAAWGMSPASDVVSPLANAADPAFAARLPALRLPRPAEGAASSSAAAATALSSSGAGSQPSPFSSREVPLAPCREAPLAPCPSRRKLIPAAAESGTAAAETSPSSPFATTGSRRAPWLPVLFEAAAEPRPPTPSDCYRLQPAAQLLPPRHPQIQPAAAWPARKTVSFGTPAPAPATATSSRGSGSGSSSSSWARAALSPQARVSLAPAAHRTLVASRTSDPGPGPRAGAAAGQQRFEDFAGEAVEPAGQQLGQAEQLGAPGDGDDEDSDAELGAGAAAGGETSDGDDDDGNEDEGNGDGVCVELSSSVARRYQRVDSLAAALARMRRRNEPGSEDWPQRRQELKLRLLTMRREGDPMGVVETLRDVRKLPFPARVGVSWLH
ncbi:hypothetical protein HXX76_001528 [Chlamydomonas incerta]|uniref:Uncharacterized protein n=1 Tax=Chlamydomonas incerta TaxID=51695 RepID=A0A836B1A1_CHLIN|nr:hypothetical protein HXX76_001528 [Chlamydomonas incerta]|eukprot:KAG2444785.1 hypothetical protein HXX76_001528 [Chlamydomonas incerta]